MQGRTKVQISGGAIVNGPQKFGGPGRGPLLNFGKTGGDEAPPVCTALLCNSQFRDVYSDFTKKKKKSKTQYFLLLVYIFLKNYVITCFHFL